MLICGYAVARKGLLSFMRSGNGEFESSAQGTIIFPQVLVKHK
jgi:hypothetical protein